MKFINSLSMEIVPSFFFQWNFTLWKANMCLTSCEVCHHSNKSFSVWFYSVDINLNCEDTTNILISDPWGGDFCRGCQMLVLCTSVLCSNTSTCLHRTTAHFLQASWHHLGEEFDLRPNVSLIVTSLQCRCSPSCLLMHEVCADILEVWPWNTSLWF